MQIKVQPIIQPQVMLQMKYEEGFHDGYQQAMREMPELVRCKDCTNGYQCEFDVRCENPHKPSMYGQHFPNDWWCADGKSAEK